jgi:hypothetical protein
MRVIEQTIPSEYLDLAEVQAHYEEELFDRPNVVGVALGMKLTDGEDTGEQAVTVLVESKLDAELLSDAELIPRDLDGRPTDVQEVGMIFAGPAGATMERELGAAPAFAFAPPSANGAVAMQTELLDALVLKNRVRPVMGGFSCAHHKVTAGTIATGCYDWNRMPDVPQRYYLLSNNHVIANSNVAAIGDPVLQPGPIDGGTLAADVVGRLARFVPIKWKTPTAAPLNYVDAAIAEVDFHNLNREVYWIGYVRRTYTAPKVGDFVQKTGRTTNFTTGRVTNINATVDVNYGSGQVARFARQILAQTASGRAMGAPGDSGSLITNLEEEGVGLLFAGSATVTVANHLNYVQSLLQVRVTEI